MKNIPLRDLYYLENPDLKQLFRIMRISIFLLFFCLFSLMAENSHSQNARVTINRSDAPLESILNEIESQTDYLFIYKEDVNVKMRKTIQVNGKPVSEVLPILLTGSSIGYKMEGNHIILTRDVALAAQQQGVTGVVTDVLGEPLIGVTVMLKGDMQGTVTDINGRFSLSAEQGDVIVVSYIGYASQEIRLKDTKLLRIMMKEDVELLDEVVVIGYGSISKKELTSAVSHISGKDMLQIGSGNPAMQIQGKVSGLAVENSTPSDPNSSPSIQVRGVSSRSAGLGPLIVIDGIPGGSLDNLNENDIGSIDVLKDGAASAIYGTRGSNGVIVVTTKKGTMDGKIHTSYSGFVNITTPVRELNVLSATDFREQKRGDDYGADTDWFDELTKVAVSHSHTLQVMGGNTKTNYKATVDYKNTDGIDLRSERQQVGARLSLNHTGKSDLYNVILNVAPRTVKYQDADYDTFRSALLINPTIPVMDPEQPGKYTQITTYSTNNPVEILKLEKSGGERTILSWIEGRDLEEVLPELSEQEQYKLGRQAGIILRKIHSIPLDSADVPATTKREKKLMQLARYEESDVRISGDEIAVAYVKDNINSIWNKTPVYMHGDFHPGNLFYFISDLSEYHLGTVFLKSLKLVIEFLALLTIPSISSCPNFSAHLMENNDACATYTAFAVQKSSGTSSLK